MMLSQSMHAYGASSAHFQPLPSSNGDLDSHSSMHHLGHNNNHNGNHTGQHKSAGSTPGPIRRRISRACDQCNQLRTKCDGKLPCQHCVDFALKCEYARERKKRGKASRKDIQAAAAAAAAAAANGGHLSAGSASPTESLRGLSTSSRRDSDLLPPPRPGSLRKKSSSASTRTSIGDLHDMAQQQMHHHLGGPVGSQQHHGHHQGHLQHHHQHSISSDSGLSHLGHENGMQMHFDRMSPFHQQQSPNVAPQNPSYPQPDFLMSPHSQSPHNLFPPSAPIMPTDDGSPSWMSLPSPPSHFNTGIRYPVLLPLLPHISAVIPPVLACDLLDLYFTNPSTSFFQPASPYVLTHIFRRRSFLHPTSPRPTSPALLCAMLWVAAQTCDAPYLTATPTARGRVCQKLLELCISLLRPLVHVSFATPVRPQQEEGGNIGLGLGGLGGSPTAPGREGVGAAGTLDDVLTYIHLGIVISASEFKAASLRWWHVAWTLARELKLNREVVQESMVDHLEDDNLDHQSQSDGSVNGGHGGQPPMGEEEKEERRRTWWLLYIVDRHLALCYNRPLALLDGECQDLLQPLDDVAWQGGNFFGAEEAGGLYAGSPGGMNGMGHTQQQRTAGPGYEITGNGLYQFFLPLMAILGGVVELHHARNRPRYGRCGSEAGSPDDGLQYLVNQIQSQLDTYERSLSTFEASRTNPSASSPGGTAGPGELDIPTLISLSYSRHVLHVLHILTSGKWDPISMLDDTDLWISSPSFISSTAHAVSAAEAIGNILKYDPDLSFMPYFFGIYLLQGSFLLLLIADKLQGEASEAVTMACETIVRAHEVCVVTLNTEYQRNFRKVMRSALNQVRGRGAPEDVDEQKLKRREVLQLYRWCGNGTGLAL